MKCFFFYLLVPCLLLMQCKPHEQKVTTEEALQFAKNVEKAAVKHRPGILTSNIILQALSERMKKEKDIVDFDEVEKGLDEGFKDAELDRTIYNIIGKTGSFEKVKLYEKNGAQRIIFRAYGDGGLNYFDMELTKLRDKVGIADMLIYSSGENISKSIAVLVKKLTDNGVEKSPTGDTETFDSVKRLMEKENYKAAKEEFDLLPVSVKNTRQADLLNLQIVSNLDSTLYRQEVEKFEKKYAAEPHMQLSLIDIYYTRKNYDGVLHAIDEIDSLINKDSFLDYYRGLMWRVKGNSDKAAAYYKKVNAGNPRFPGAWAELMVYYLEKGDTENAKICFRKYRSIPDAKDAVIHTYETLYPFLKE